MIHLGNQTSVLSLSFVLTAPWSPSSHATNWRLSCEELRVDYNSHSSSPFVRWKYVSFGAEGSCRTYMKDSKVCIGWISKQTTAGFCQTMRRVHNLCFSHWTFLLKLEQTSKANNFCRAVIFSPWCWSSCRVSTLVTLSAKPESINTSLLTPPEITGLAEVDKSHVWSSIVIANVSSSPDCSERPLANLACPPLRQLAYDHIYDATCVWRVPFRTQLITE